MKTALSITLGFIAILIIGFISCIGTYISISNTGTRFEANIEKQHKSTQNVLSTYTVKISEMVQVPEMYKNDLKEVISSTFEGRYGKDGSKAVMQWIKENNLQFDSKLYQNLQVVIESGRDEFKLAQNKKLDICAEYEAIRGYVWSGFWLNLAGFPKKEIDDLCKIVLDDKTNDVFKTMNQSPIDLRKDN